MIDLNIWIIPHEYAEFDAAGMQVQLVICLHLFMAFMRKTLTKQRVPELFSSDQVVSISSEKTSASSLICSSHPSWSYHLSAPDI